MNAERPPRARRTAVIGGGWAGLAAAVEAVSHGDAVTLFEMAPALGGRARRLPEAPDGLRLDNGQHILIGAYVETLRLLARVGVDERDALLRLPLQLTDARGRGLQLPGGASAPAFVRGVLRARGWSLGERLALLAAAGGWWLRGFRCDPALSVAQLTARLPAPLRRGWVEPLCVAALNTPAEQASAQVFLNVLRAALFAGPGAADLLLPRVDLGALFPDAAAHWLAARGVRLCTGTRVQAVRPEADGWRVVTAQAAATGSARTTELSPTARRDGPPVGTAVGRGGPACAPAVAGHDVAAMIATGAAAATRHGGAARGAPAEAGAGAAAATPGTDATPAEAARAATDGGLLQRGVVAMPMEAVNAWAGSTASAPDPVASMRLGAPEGRRGVDAHGTGTASDAAADVPAERFDRVLLACSAAEAARLAEPHAPAWSALARGLRHEPIVTVLLRCPGTTLPAPMLALECREDAPAQFVFDLGRLRDPRAEPAAAGVLAFVVSGAARCIERGLEATARQVAQQARDQLGGLLRGEPELVKVLSEKRATFLCTPGLRRPPAAVAPGLAAAGDYVDGPYPATLEGAVRSGLSAAGD